MGNLPYDLKYFFDISKPISRTNFALFFIVILLLVNYNIINILGLANSWLVYITFTTIKTFLMSFPFAKRSLDIKPTISSKKVFILSFFGLVLVLCSLSYINSINATFVSELQNETTLSAELRKQILLTSITGTIISILFAVWSGYLLFKKAGTKINIKKLLLYTWIPIVFIAIPFIYGLLTR